MKVHNPYDGSGQPEIDNHRLTDAEVERLWKEDPIGLTMRCCPPYVTCDYGERECDFCDKPAVSLCDGTIRCKTTTTNRVYWFVCSAPMCEDHTKRVEVMFASGEEGFSDTIDYCPRCAPFKGQLIRDDGVLKT